jgi:hypothetical protein
MWRREKMREMRAWSIKLGTETYVLVGSSSNCFEEK